MGRGPTQTSWFTIYPTAKKLAYSYSTCARCHNRDQWSCTTTYKHDCIWNVDLGKCEDAGGSDLWSLATCGGHNKDCCGGELNAACEWNTYTDTCEPASIIDTIRVWGCGVTSNGNENCRCIGGEKNAQDLDFGTELCRPWNFPDTLGYEATGLKCDRTVVDPLTGEVTVADPRCLDTWCFVNGCSCGAKDVYEVDGKQISHLTCAQCDNRTTQKYCEKHTSCEWHVEQAFCRERNRQECDCTDEYLCDKLMTEGHHGYCVTNKLQDWSRTNKQWKCSRMEMWPAVGPQPAPWDDFHGHTAMRDDLYYFDDEGSLWKFSIPYQLWSRFKHYDGPPGRGSPVLLADEASKMLYLFGGKGSETYFNDLWRFDCDNESWRLLSPEGAKPTPRQRVAATIFRRPDDPSVEDDPHGLSIQLYGGYDGANVLGDWWTYSVDFNYWYTSPGCGYKIEPRVDANLAFISDLAEPKLLLIGGTLYPTGNKEFESAILIDIVPDNVINACNRWLRRKFLEVTPDPQYHLPTPRYLAALNTYGKSAIYAMGWSSEHNRIYDDIWQIKIRESLVDGVWEYGASWDCLLPPDPTLYTHGDTNAPDEVYHGWSGVHASLIPHADGGYLYFGLGWSDLRNYNSIRRVDIGALRTAECRAYGVFKRARPPQCRLDFFPDSSSRSGSAPQARFGHGGAVQNGALYIFGGILEDNRVSNEMWKFTDAIPRRQQSTDADVVVDVEEGTKERGKSWSQIKTVPLNLAPRSDMVFVATRDILWMYGGLLEDGTPTRDEWIFDPVNDRWTAFGINEAAPHLSHSCATVDRNQDVWIYGGKDQSKSVSATLWRIEVLRKRWAKIADKSQENDMRRYGCAMHITLNGDLVILFGADANSNTLNKPGLRFYIGHLLDRTDSDKRSSSSTSGSSDDVVSFQTFDWPASAPKLNGCQWSYTSVGDKLWVLGGRPWDMFQQSPEHQLSEIAFEYKDGSTELQLGIFSRKCSHLDPVILSPSDNDNDYVDEETKCWAPIGHRPKLQLAGASLVHLGSRLYIFGGQAPGRLSGELLSLALFHPQESCSPGSFFVETQNSCEYAPPGAYSTDGRNGDNGTRYTICPVGTENLVWGADSPSFCKKCKFGHFKSQNMTGAFSEPCQKCRHDAYCPIGSENELSEEPENVGENADHLEAPPEYIGSKEYSDILLLIWFGLLILFGLLIIFILGYRFNYGFGKTIRIFGFLDRMRALGNTDSQRQTFVGIFVTLLIVLVTVYIAYYMMLETVVEDKTTIPDIITSDLRKTSTYFYIAVSLRLNGFTPDCGGTVAAINVRDKNAPVNDFTANLETCPPEINSPCNVDKKVDEKSFKCNKCSNKCMRIRDKVCEVAFEATECDYHRFQYNATLDFLFSHVDAFATLIHVNVSTSSSIPPPEMKGLLNLRNELLPRDQYRMRLPHTFKPDKGTVFKGLQKASQLTAVCFPSIYTYESENEERVRQHGFHLAHGGAILGQMADASQISYSQGFKVQILLQRNTMTISTRRKHKEFLELMGEFGGNWEIVLISAGILAIIFNLILKQILKRRRRVLKSRTYCVLRLQTLQSENMQFYDDEDTFFVRVILGTQEQWDSKQIHTRLMRSSLPIEADAVMLDDDNNKRSQPNPGDESEDDDAPKSEMRVVSIPYTKFEMTLTHERLGLSENEELEKLVDYEVLLRIQIVTCERKRIVAQTDAELPTVSECEHKDDGHITLERPLIEPAIVPHGIYTEPDPEGEMPSKEEPAESGSSGFSCFKRASKKDQNLNLEDNASCVSSTRSRMSVSDGPISKATISPDCASTGRWRGTIELTLLRTEETNENEEPAQKLCIPRRAKKTTTKSQLIREKDKENQRGSLAEMKGFRDPLNRQFLPKQGVRETAQEMAELRKELEAWKGLVKELYKQLNMPKPPASLPLDGMPPSPPCFPAPLPPCPPCGGEVNAGVVLNGDDDGEATNETNEVCGADLDATIRLEPVGKDAYNNDQDGVLDTNEFDNILDELPVILPVSPIRQAARKPM